MSISSGPEDQCLFIEEALRGLKEPQEFLPGGPTSPRCRPDEVLPSVGAIRTLVPFGNMNNNYRPFRGLNGFLDHSQRGLAIMEGDVIYLAHPFIWIF